jgi:hypothetical protein
LLVSADIVSSSLVLFSLMMEAIRSFETSVIMRSTPRHIPEDVILHSRRRESIQILHNMNSVRTVSLIGTWAEIRGSLLLQFQEVPIPNRAIMKPFRWPYDLPQGTYRNNASNLTTID